MNETVEYILKVQDQMSASLKNIEANTQHLNDGVGKTHDSVGKLKSAFAEFFAIAKIFEFGQEAFSSYQKAAEGSAQLQATLKATGDAIGFTKKQLDEQADSLSKVSLNSADSITQMQSMLAIFPNLKGDNFKKAEQAVLDLSAKMKIDLPSAVKMVGKAMQGDSRGMMALKNAGVMFTDAEQAKIESLVKTGHAKEAQAMLFQKMDATIGGSAAAAAKANPFTVMKNQLEPLMDKVGEFINRLLVKIMPIAEKIFGVLANALSFIESHKTIFEYLAAGIGAMVLAWKAYTIGVEIAESQTAILNAVTALNPIMLIVIGVAALIAILIVAYNKCAIVKKIFDEIWKAIKFAGEFMWACVKILGEIIGAVVRWVYHLGFVHTIVKLIKEAFGEVKEAIKWAIEKIEAFWNKLKSAAHVVAKILGITISTSTTEDAGGTGDSDGTNKPDNSGGGGGGSGDKNTPSGIASEPKEAKLTNINIKIDTLAKLDIHSQTLGASMEQIKQMVAAALLGAVNNTQLQISSGR